MKPRRYPYRYKPESLRILDSRFYTRLIVETEIDGKKIAEITLNDVISAEGYTIRLKPRYD